MSKVQMLKLFINERLTAAVEEIFVKFLTTIADYEKELSRSREENERQRKLLEALFNPQLKLHRADAQQLLDRKEDVPSEQQGTSPSPDQQDPEPSHIKEEQQELCTNQEREKLQELVIVNIPSSHVSLKNQRQPEENREAEPPVKILIEEIETESDGEDCGGLEPLMNLHPDRHLQPDTDDKTLDSPETEVSDGDCTETREPQSDLNSLENKEIVSDMKFNTDNNSFICSQCGEKFASEESLQRHMTFTHQICLTDHMGVHAGETQLSCHVCEERFALRIQLRRHKCVGKSSQMNGGGTKQKKESRCREATNTFNSFSCSKCNKSFDDFYSLERHLRTHKKEKPFSCSFCSKSFVWRAQMIIHMRMHTGEKPLSCHFCYERFRWPSQVKRHKCSREKCLELYQRPIEEDREAELQGLEEAAVTQSTVTPVHVKSEDDEEAPQSSQLHSSQTEENREAETPASISTEQMEIEDDGEDYGGLEPYSDTHLQPDTEDNISNSSETDVGDGEWTETRGTQSDLSQIYSVCKLRRRKTKRLFRPFSCSKCNNAFDSFRALQRHKLIHSMKKPLICPICRRTVSYMSHLTHHIVMHTGEQPLGCRRCYKRFTWPSQVKSHKCSREKYLKHNKSPIQKKREAELQGKSEDHEETPQSSQLHPSRTEENREAETPASISTEQMEPEDDGEDCGGSEPDPDRHLQPDTADTTPEYGRDGDDWMKIREPQTDLNCQKSNEGKPKSFSCLICGLKLASEASFQNHALLHFKRKIFNCGNCDKTFSCYTKFLRHKNDEHPEPELEAASISTEQMKREDGGEDYGGLEPYFDSHLQPDTADTIRKYRRDGDDWMKIREPQTDLNCQKSNVVKPKPFSCSICGQKLSSKYTLQKHILLHFKKKTFKCVHCNKTFSCYTKFLRHKNDEHPEPEPELELEAGSISTEQMKREDGGDEYGGLEPYSDTHLQPDTAKATPKYGRGGDDWMKIREPQTDLNRQKSNVVKPKPFSCSICGQKLSSKFSLQRHILVHLKRNVFNCIHCDKTFSCYTEFLSHKNDEHPEPELELEAGSFSTEQMKREDGGDEYGGLEPDPDRHLQPDTAETTPKYGRGGDDWMKIREPQTDLNRQKSNEVKPKPFSCSICGQKLSSKFSLQRHILVHLKRNVFNCIHCDKTFSCYTEFLSHKNDEHPEPELDLEAGSISTEQKEIEEDGEDYGGLEPYSDTHLQPDTEDKISNSSETDVSDGEWTETRGTQSDLKSLKTEAIHVSDIKSNTDNNLFACCLCGKKFANKQNRQRHMTVSHRGIKPFCCPLCDKAFKKESSMHVHMAVHAGMKQFRCRHCEKIFKLFRGLKRHKCVQKAAQQKRKERKAASDSVCYKLIRKKTKRPFRLFSCKNCNNTFDNFKALVRHRKIHSKKPIICPICCKTISTMTHLRNHIAMHTGEKPFSCHHCYKMFRWPSQVRKHKCSHEKYNEHYKSPLQRKREAELQGLDEADVAPFPVESEDYEETPQSSQLHSSQTEENREAETPASISTEQMEPEDEPEDCGGSEPDPGTHLQPDTADTTPEYGRDGDLKSHTKRRTTKKLSDCPLCIKKFKDNVHVTQHLKAHVPDKKPYICPFCKKAHTVKRSWVMHMKTYIGQKPADQLLPKSE